MSTPKVQLIKDARPEVIEAGDNLAAAIRGLMPFPLVMNAAANGLLAKWEAAKSAPTEVPQEAAGHPIGFPTHPATWPDGLPTTDEAIAREAECPNCKELIIQPRGDKPYCENCGWPEENRPEDREAQIDQVATDVLEVVSPEGYDTEEWKQTRNAVAKNFPRARISTPSPSQDTEDAELRHIPKSHVGGTVKDAFDRLFAYLDYVRPDAPRNAADPYKVGTVSSYSFEDLRRIADELRAARNSPSSHRREIR